MEYELEVMKEFDNYCREKREIICNIPDQEQKACQEKVLVARSLIYHEAVGMVSDYSKYTSILNDKCEVDEYKNKIKEIDDRDIRKEFIWECEMNHRLSDVNTTQFSSLQEAMLGVICAGLEDISFNKWKANLEDAVCQVQSLEQVKRLPRFSNACAKVLDSLDIDFSDIEEEFRLIFEPECIYNTLILLVTAIKTYCEILKGVYENRKNEMKVRYRRNNKKVHPPEALRKR